MLPRALEKCVCVCVWGGSTYQEDVCCLRQWKSMLSRAIEKWGLPIRRTYLLDGSCQVLEHVFIEEDEYIGVILVLPPAQHVVKPVTMTQLSFHGLLQIQFHSILIQFNVFHLYSFVICHKVLQNNFSYIIPQIRMRPAGSRCIFMYTNNSVLFPELRVF